MFTGLIETIGHMQSTRKIGSEMDLEVGFEMDGGAARIGESIALSGVCCTVTKVLPGGAQFRLSEETIRRTWFGEIQPGQLLNLERALRAGDPLGGHMVQGHVDGIGRIELPVDPEAGGELGISIPDNLQQYCVEKGSISVDGVSLTIAEIDAGRAMIAIIPHTAVATTLGQARQGQAINLEVDVLAKYVERMLAARLDAQARA
ncbi:MAG: riboflavin synthase [Planctomycetota bacterium]|jgi:riboflavin synthase